MSDAGPDRGSAPNQPDGAVQDADGQWRSADGAWVWNGSGWFATGQPSAAPPGVQPPSVQPARAPASKNWFERHKVWTGVGLVVLIVVIISAVSGGGSSSDKNLGSNSTDNPSSSSSGGTGTTSVPTGSVVDRVRSALGSSISSEVAVGDSQVRQVQANGSLLTIVLATPEGGFDGPSTDDANGLASAAFSKAYLAGWRGAAFVKFEGGLVSRATGQDLPNAVAFSYRVNGGQARQINWSSASDLFSIDWSLYRLFCYPAFKGCT